MRLSGKVAVIVGAGQSPGETLGNGRATAMRFADEGASVLCVDRDAATCAADVVDEGSLAGALEAAIGRWGRMDIVHSNVVLPVDGGRLVRIG